MRIQQLIEDNLKKRSATHTSRSMLVAIGVDTQLGSSCVSAPLATNVDLWNPIIIMTNNTSLNVTRRVTKHISSAKWVRTV